MKWKDMDCENCWFKEICDIPYYTASEDGFREKNCNDFLKKIKKKMSKK